MAVRLGKSGIAMQIAGAVPLHRPASPRCCPWHTQSLQRACLELAVCKDSQARPTHSRSRNSSLQR